MYSRLISASFFFFISNSLGQIIQSINSKINAMDLPTGGK